MKPHHLIVFVNLLAAIFINSFDVQAIVNNKDTTIAVPVGGNTWCTQCNDDENIITDAGIQNWVQKEITFETFVRVGNPGTLKVSVKAKTDGESLLKLSVNGKSKNVVIKGQAFKTYDAGTFVISDTGYIKIVTSAEQKTGIVFADIAGYELSGSSINANTVFVKSNEGNFFYWGRRGPSVHLNFPFEDSIKAEWFYNEVTVADKQDIVGSYFMANGFKDGYFGMQVNSATERRILFSVWSPYSTDDPKSIPADMQIKLLKKGEGVYTGEFGNEGSGGQSFLQYNWQAGTTYKFLLHGLPDGNGSTVYTAYFFAPEKNKWLLIASFKRPKTNSYLTRFHSFLENFIPSQGNQTREVQFGNQWVCSNTGKWVELVNAVFTYDNTAAKRYRMDYAGGIRQGKFYLKNCGFFNEYTAYKSVFKRAENGKLPDVDFKNLP